MSAIKRQSSFKMHQPADVLFPLFSAEGEKLWVPGWDYKNISGSEGMHEDFIFLTQSHGGSAQDIIWLVKSYDPEKYYVQFYRVEPEDKVGLVTVRCIEIEENVTDVEVTYEYTALSEPGEKFIAHFTAEHYQEFISSWKTHLLHYFHSL